MVTVSRRAPTMELLLAPVALLMPLSCTRLGEILSITASRMRNSICCVESNEESSPAMVKVAVTAAL